MVSIPPPVSLAPKPSLHSPHSFFLSELADPSQNQAENPPEQTVPSNNGGHTIRLFGTNIAEGQKEVKD
jgi:hypothetical protein